MTGPTFPFLYLAFANASRKKKGSKELKSLESGLHPPISVGREGIGGLPLAHELITTDFPAPDLRVLHLLSEPEEPANLYLNSAGNKRKPVNWDEFDLGHLTDLKLVVLDGGGSLDWVERILFAGAPAVVALQYEPKKEARQRGESFIQDFYRTLAMGESLEVAIEVAQQSMEAVEAACMVIPSDPYEYWDFKEAFLKKEVFPWGIFTLPNQEIILGESIFPAPEPVEEVAELEVVEEEELVSEKVVENMLRPSVELARAQTEAIPAAPVMAEGKLVEEKEIIEVENPAEKTPVVPVALVKKVLEEIEKEIPVEGKPVLPVEEEEKEEELIEKEPVKEAPVLPVPGTPSRESAPLPIQEPAVFRLRSNQVNKDQVHRPLTDVRSRESEGILRKVAYWSQELSPELRVSPTVEEKKDGRLTVVQPETDEPENSLPSRESQPEPLHREPIRLKTNDTTETPTKNYGSFRKVFAMVGMGVMMLVVGSSLLYNYLQADKTAALRSLAVFEPGNSYNILLLPFSPDQQCQSRNSLQESAVRDHLSSLPETEDMALQIAFLNGVACPSNSEEAKATGQVHNAQLVIWGENKVDNSGKALIQVNYVSLESGKTNPIRPVAQQVGQRALGDVYDLQEGNFAGESQDLVYWILAVAHLRNEDYPSSISYLEQITMREQAEYAVLMHMMAKCYQGMGRLEDALTAYGEAIFLDPENPNVYHHRGRLYQQLNQRKLALADYAEAIRLNPQHLKAQFQQKLLIEGKGISSNDRGQTASIPVANN